ncbi:MAG: SDR family oxidoreductase [Cypionkella sp.]
MTLLRNAAMCWRSKNHIRLTRYSRRGSEGASIVNVASIVGYGRRTNPDRAKGVAATQGFPDPAAVVAEFGIPNEASCPISKEILLVWAMMAAHQAQFKARGIRVNAVSPGPVETPILAQFRTVLANARVDSDIDRVGRAGTAADVAPVVLF